MLSWKASELQGITPGRCIRYESPERMTRALMQAQAAVLCGLLDLYLPGRPAATWTAYMQMYIHVSTDGWEHRGLSAEISPVSEHAS